MRIDSIKNGIVIDHITAGKAMQLYHMLKLDRLDCQVAIIKNAVSKLHGRKDIIKIDSSIEINLDVVGYVSPHATICTIRDGIVTEKKHLELPETLTDIVSCKNPRCITTTERGIQQIFNLTNHETGEYRCAYCDTKYEG